MVIEIKVPSPGESITEVIVARWLVDNGSYVDKDQEIAEIESDKATLPLISAASGALTIKQSAGSKVEVGAVVCAVDTSAQKPVVPKTEVAQKENKPIDPVPQPEFNERDVKVTPVARRIMEDQNLTVDDVLQGLRKIGKKEVETIMTQSETQTVEPAPRQPTTNKRTCTEEKMSSLRKKLSERLVAVKNETAMLTTFNEVDMSAVVELRQNHQQEFLAKYSVKIGFMSLFIKASSIALQLFPEINASINNDTIIFHHYSDIAIAVQSPKGLLVPVIRNVEDMSIPAIEQAIKVFADKARVNRIGMDDLTGGTFTITNGGTFGSLLSTPIINPPQSAILGLHNIVDRPVAIKGKVEIRPMMYTALSYDHRLIDGKSAVSFLVKIKELIEAPYKMLLTGGNPDRLLLGI